MVHLYNRLLKKINILFAEIECLKECCEEGGTGGGFEYRLVDRTDTDKEFDLTEDGIVVSTIDLEEYLTAPELYGPNGIFNGGYFNIPGTYQFFVWADDYLIDNVRYQNYISDTITLDPADGTFDRKDRIFIQNDETFGFVTGTPGLIVFPPDIDDFTQVTLVDIIVEAGTTSPSYVTTELIHDDNVGEPSEWTTIENTANTRIQLGNTDQAQSGANSIKVEAVLGADQATFTNDSTIPGVDISLFVFRAYIPSGEDAAFRFRFINSTTQDNTSMTVSDGEFNFRSSVVDAWQIIIIPTVNIPDFHKLNIDVVEMRFKAGSTCYVDNVIFQLGLPPSPSIVIPEYTLGTETGNEVVLYRDGLDVGQVPFPPGSAGVGTEDDGATVLGNSTVLNFLDRLRAIDGGAGKTNIDYYPYETVSSIPSYLLPDGDTVIDNGDSTYDVLIVDGGSIKASRFGLTGDLRYIDFTSDGSTATILSADAASTDVGKTVWLHGAHLNPDTAGSEVPFTQLGRIVSFRGIIQSVVPGVSFDIDGIPNLAVTGRGYIYTENCETYYRMTRFAQYRKIQNIDVDVEGIIGINPNYKGIYSAESNDGIDIYLSDSGVSILSNTARAIKFTDEMNPNTMYGFDFLAGDNNFHTNIPTYPTDKGLPIMLLGDYKYAFAARSAGNSVRDIILENQNYTPDDLDGNDGFFTKLFSGDSTGGANYDGTGERRSQRIIISNSNARCKNGWISNFQNNGFSNEVHLTDCYLNDVQHFTGERGRELEPDNSTNVCVWTYTDGSNITGQFNIASNVITAPAGQDFSWYDHIDTIGSLFMRVSVGPEVARIASITDAKTAVLEPGISDGNYSTVFVAIEGRDYYDHAMYVHPSMIVRMIRCKSNNGPGNIKMYSDSGSVTDEWGEWYIYDSELYQLETLSGGTSSTACVTRIDNSRVYFYNMSGYVYMRNSELLGGTFQGHEYIDEGNVIYPDSTDMLFTVNDSNLRHRYFNTKGSLRITYIGTDNFVEVVNLDIPDNGRIPAVRNGTLLLKDIETRRGMIGAYTAPDAGADTVLIFDHFKQQNYDGNFTFLRNNDWDVFTISWKNSLYFKNRKDTRILTFDNTGKNIGKLGLPTDVNGQGYIRQWDTPIEVWAGFNEWDYGAVNLHRATRWRMQDISFGHFYGLWTSEFYPVSATSIPPVPETGSTPPEGLLDNQLPMTNGILTIEFKGTVNMNPYYHKDPTGGTFGEHVRMDTTFGNFVVKSLIREEGEVATFKIDYDNGRLIEINSTHHKKYVSAQPTDLSVVGERRYLDNETGGYWEYEIDFADDSAQSYAGTQSSVTPKDDTGADLVDENTVVITRTVLDITGTPEWSIGQEKTDESDLKSFDFTLNIQGGGTLEFEYDTEFDVIDLTLGNLDQYPFEPHYYKHLWAFKSSDAAGYRCVINNRTGQILFDQVISETLDPANMITVNSGDKITRREWVLKGIKTLTTDTGNTVNVSNPLGNVCNKDSANSNTSYTATGRGGSALVKINTLAEPTFTNANKIAGATWVSATDMWMGVVDRSNDGSDYEFYFLAI